jgi:hypothetical protein
MTTDEGEPLKESTALGLFRCVTIAGVFIAACCLGVFSVGYAESKSMYDQVRGAGFNKLPGGCAVQLHSAEILTASAYNAKGVLFENCWQRLTYLTTLDGNDASVLVGGNSSFLSEPFDKFEHSGPCKSTEGDEGTHQYADADLFTAGEEVPCWYAIEPWVLTRHDSGFFSFDSGTILAGYRCGNPPCVKISDPAVELEHLRLSVVDERPMSAVALCVALLLFAVAFCGLKDMNGKPSLRFPSLCKWGVGHNGVVPSS